MKVYIANFGRQNYEWPVCRDRGTVATMNAVRAQKFWEANDREGYIADRMVHETTAAGKKPTKATASRWFNLMTIIAETSGDMWVHKDGDDLWWTVSRRDEPYFETKMEPIERGQEVVVCHKPCEKWSNVSKKGVRLRWNELHPKAKDFLSTEATLQSLSALYRDYTLALIGGEDLSPWHNDPLWAKRREASRNGYAPVKHGTLADRIAYQRASELFSAADAAERMARTAIGTTNSANGQVVERVVKRKDLKFPSAAALQDYIADLMASQEYCCELTGLPLEFDEVNGDQAMFASLDRIDSSGHYVPGNLQVVCRFANFWKGASDDGEFRRLISVVRSVAIS
ncbi:hypothetical protein [Tabrizicola oligotrophica]|uniref:Restriction endonuclease n=1 Tax=Tabrizicola oligotrophica TaxID=2710650 RepID=A0A6M0QX89_9RHOB|nr:hypothetical protein [Tabrizicola oligotrophica]NEY91997.1 hypothetical protein [Tabrizicola oligotrophica]